LSPKARGTLLPDDALAYAFYGRPRFAPLWQKPAAACPGKWLDAREIEALVGGHNRASAGASSSTAAAGGASAGVSSNTPPAGATALPSKAMPRQRTPQPVSQVVLDASPKAASVAEPDQFNLRTPATVFHLGKNGGKVLGGGLEAGMMPMGEAAGKAGGLRPGVLDARGADWDGPALRGLTSESPEAHAARDCPHFFVGTNWMLKKYGAVWSDKMRYLTAMLATVATWLREERSCHVHCIPLLFPPGGLLLLLA